MTDKTFCHFRQFYAILLPPNHTKNQNFGKIKESTRRFHYFTPVYQKSPYDLQFIFLKLGFTPCKAEQQLQDMELQEKETQKDRGIQEVWCMTD